MVVEAIKQARKSIQLATHASLQEEELVVLQLEWDDQRSLLNDAVHIGITRVTSDRRWSRKQRLPCQELFRKLRSLFIVSEAESNHAVGSHKRMKEGRIFEIFQVLLGRRPVPQRAPILNEQMSTFPALQQGSDCERRIVNTVKSINFRAKTCPVRSRPRQPNRLVD